MKRVRDKSCYDFDSADDYELYLANCNPQDYFKQDIAKLAADFQHRVHEALFENYKFEASSEKLEELYEQLEDFCWDLTHLNVEKVVEL